MSLLYGTHSWCRPADVTATLLGPGWRRWDAPACRLSGWAHRVEWAGDGDPPSWDAALDAWGDRDDLPFACATAESAHGDPWPDAPPRLAPTRWVGMTRVGPPPPPGPFPVGHVSADAAARWLSGFRPAEAEDGATVSRWWLRGLHARGGVTWAARDGDVVVGVLTQVTGPEGVGRLQDVFTAPSWRRRGVLRALVAAAAAACSTQVAAAEEGAVVDVYRTLGFRPATRATALVRRARSGP